MKIEIRRERGYYAIYVDGRFYGSYDTVSEARNDMNEIKEEHSEVA